MIPTEPAQLVGGALCSVPLTVAPQQELITVGKRIMGGAWTPDSIDKNPSTYARTERQTGEGRRVYVPAGKRTLIATEPPTMTFS